MYGSDVYDPPVELNLADHLLGARIRAGDGDRVALRGAFGRRTYQQVDVLANRYGNALRALGVDREDRVLLALPDSPAYVGALFGILKLGAVAVMLNPGLAEDRLAIEVGRSRAPVAVTTDERVAAFEAAAEAAGEPLRLLLARGPDGDAEPGPASDTEVADDPDREAADAAWPRGTGGHPTLAELHPSGELATVPTHRDDPAIWLFSGGTTGTPKAVPQTHRSYANTTELYARRTVGYRPDDVTLSVPKLYFGYATGANLLFPFAVGASAVLFDEHPTPELLFDLIAEHAPTILVNVPSMVAAMLDHGRAGDADLSGLRFATSAGEALPAALHRRWVDRFGVQLLDGLGTAEMWHIFVTNRPGRARPGTLGRAVEGFDVRARDDDGDDVAPGEVGRLWVRGGSLGLGYWQDRDRTVEAFRGEWFVGGDLIRVDGDGWVTYVGRGDDALKVKGKWFVPAELEGVLLEHPGVAEAAVVGVADADGLTRPVAVVVPAEGTEPETLPAELTQLALDELAAYKHPRRVVVTDELERTHLGKVDRAAVRRLAEDAGA